MNKKDLLKTVPLASAVLAAGAISFSGVEASADTLDTTPTTANETATPTTNQVTAEQVAAAKTDVNTAEEAVKNQESVVSSALSDKQAAQTAETTAQEALVAAQATAETATPEAIQAVEAEIVEAETTVSETEALLESTKQEASTAQTQADQAQAVADTANTSYTEAQAQADAAQETVTQLENQTVNVEQAQTSVDTAKQDVATAEAAVAEAEQALVTAQESDQTLAQDIAEAKTALDTAKDAESNAQTTVVGLEAQVADTANKVTEAQAVVDSLQNEVSYNVDINLPQNVKDAVTKFLSETRTPETVAELKQVIESAQIRENLEQYWKLNITGGDEVVDLDNLTTKQIEQLNQFAVDVYNTLAETIGLSKVTANTKMIELAKVRSEMYDAKDAEFEHDRTILRESEKVVFPNTNITAGENLAYTITRTAPTLRELMEDLNTSMVYMTLIDAHSNYGHWRNFNNAKSIGMYIHDEESMDMGWQSVNYKPWYVFATYTDQFTAGGLLTRAIEENNLVHAADVTFDANSSALTNAITQLEKALLDESQAKEDLVQAVTALHQAKADVETSTSEYNRLLSTESETTKAQANLDVVKTKLSEAKAKYDQAVDALDALTAQKAEQAQKLATAKAVLNQAQAKAADLYSDYLAKQAKADELKEKVNQLNQNVQNLETDLANAKQAVVDAKTKLLGLQEAEENLVKAQEAYDKAVKAREEACAVYQQESAKLTELQDNYSLAVKHYLNLLNLYNLQEQVKAPTEGTGDDQGTVKNTGTPAPIGINTPSNVSTIKATGMVPTSKEQTRFLDVEKAPVQAASLPQTGSNESILSSLAGFTVLGLGLSLAIKRRKYTEE
ncbi:TPA: SEC10/PgrA surface exclusion domain-containing protein [Streptococcus suis]